MRGNMAGLVGAIGNGALGPGVLAVARSTDPWLGPNVLCPPGVGLRSKAEHIGDPQLLLALGAPALLPRPVATLWCDVGVVLRAYWPVLPAVPLASASPRRRTWVRNEHPFAHGQLHDAAGEEHEPAHKRGNEEDTRVVPRSHVNVNHGVILGDPLAFTFAGSRLPHTPTPCLKLHLLFGLGWCNEVSAMLEGAGQPRRQLTSCALVEETATRLLG
mmetsp:Transcript_54999/g.128062  ORF Transcript_54999/g.128062 Transcript_54999/m.128062 type:complete len:216 (+) Transcript_54999:978-1625(+)